MIRHIMLTQWALKWPSPHSGDLTQPTSRLKKPLRKAAGEMFYQTVPNCIFATSGLNHGKYLRCLMLMIYPKLEQIMHFRKGEAKNLQWERTIAHKYSLENCKRKMSFSGDTELSQDLPLNCSSHLLWSGESQTQKLRSKISFLYASLADSRQRGGRRSLTGKHRSEKVSQRYHKSQRLRAREGDRWANSRTV